MKLTDRQKQIFAIIKKSQPIRSKDISEEMCVPQPTIRKDLAIMTALGIVVAKPNVGFYIGENMPTGDVTRKLGSTLVKDMMSDPVTVEENISVYDTSIKMILEDCGTIHITKDGYLVGVVSRKDLIKSTLQTKDLNTLPVGVIMTRMPLLMAHPDDMVFIAAHKISNGEVDSLPVVIEEDDKFKVVGRISKTNINNRFVELLSRV